MNGNILKALQSFTDNNKARRPALDCVHFTEKYAEACEGTILARVYQDGGEPFLVNLHGVKIGAKDEVILTHDKDKVVVTVGPASYTLDACKDTYPNTEAIWPKNQPYARVCLDADNLVRIAGMVKSLGTVGVVLEYTTPCAPVVWKAENGKTAGVVMPIYLRGEHGLAEPTQADKVNNLLKLARIVLRGDGEGKEKALAALDDFLGVEE